jgi:hypothetical protein
MEYGASLCSSDADFSRFPDLNVIVPPVQIEFAVHLLISEHVAGLIVEDDQRKP